MSQNSKLIIAVTPFLLSGGLIKIVLEHAVLKTIEVLKHNKECKSLNYQKSQKFLSPTSKTQSLKLITGPTTEYVSIRKKK